LATARSADEGSVGNDGEGSGTDQGQGGNFIGANNYPYRRHMVLNNNPSFSSYQTYDTVKTLYGSTSASECINSNEALLKQEQETDGTASAVITLSTFKSQENSIHQHEQQKQQQQEQQHHDAKSNLFFNNQNQDNYNQQSLNQSKNDYLFSNQRASRAVEENLINSSGPRSSSQGVDSSNKVKILKEEFREESAELIVHSESSNNKIPKQAQLIERANSFSLIGKKNQLKNRKESKSKSVNVTDSDDEDDNDEDEDSNEDEYDEDDDEEENESEEETEQDQSADDFNNENRQNKNKKQKRENTSEKFESIVSNKFSKPNHQIEIDLTGNESDFSENNRISKDDSNLLSMHRQTVYESNSKKEANQVIKDLDEGKSVQNKNENNNLLDRKSDKTPVEEESMLESTSANSSAQWLQPSSGSQQGLENVFPITN
jgi:hypothetical protein